jgi:hypothetical protein
MAKHTADLGKGSKPDKILRDALLLELNREDLEDGKKVKKVQRLVRKIVALGLDGKIDAIKEIFDRVEGKASQSIGIGQAEDLQPLQADIRPVLTREQWLALHKA